MTSLASSMTVHSLDQRLNPDLAPPEISETMQEFNNMFDRLEGGIPETVRISRLTSRMSCAHQSVI